MNGLQIVFLGTHGQYNIGDELLLEAFLWQLGEDNSYVVNSYDPGFTQEQLGDRYDIQTIDTSGDRIQFLRHIWASDLLCFGGGSIIKELNKETGRNAYSTMAMILAIVTFAKRVARKPVAMFNIGVGPIRTKSGLRFAKAILSQVDELSVRDQGSYQLCLDIGISPEKVRLSTDAVFSTNPSWLLGRAPMRDSSHPDPELLKVAINLNFDIANPDNWNLFVQNLANGLNKIHEIHPMELHALPMQSGFKERDDSQILRAFAERVPSIKVHQHTPTTTAEAARIIGGCDLLLSERLHAIIMASILGTPTFLLSYDVKVAELGASLGLEDFTIDINQPFSTAQIVDPLLELIGDLPAARRHLKERSDIMGDSANLGFDAAREWMTTSVSGKGR